MVIVVDKVPLKILQCPVRVERATMEVPHRDRGGMLDSPGSVHSRGLCAPIGLQSWLYGKSCYPHTGDTSLFSDFKELTIVQTCLLRMDLACVAGTRGLGGGYSMESGGGDCVCLLLCGQDHPHLGHQVLPACQLP